MPKVIKKNFSNPFEDYSIESAKNVISNNQIDKNCKVVSFINEKWDITLRKLNYLDPNDYSVYTGTSGIALLKLLKDPENKANLLEVKKLLRLDHLKYRRHSFLCGDAGPLAIGAVVSNKLRDVDCRKLIDELLSLQGPIIDSHSDMANEYLYGRAGYLFALLFVNKHIKPPPIDQSIIVKIISTILECGKNEAKAGKSKFPLMYQWHNSYYLGAAHGLSGIIYLLLQAYEYVSESELINLIKPTIDHLTSIQYPSGNFPSSVGSESDRYVQWCHGAPGFVYMYTAAYKVFKDEKYLNLALKCGDVVWERGLLRKGYSICHGVAGNTYCFLELYQTTKDSKHLYRAVKFAEWCVDYTKEHEEYPPDRPLSLFEGISGPMYLLLDIQKPLEAKFPGYTL
ncbi:hypothetical protein Trydic_g17543 [Trypoxylus dichotomus]